MLKIIKVELEFIPDPDTYIFFQKGTRGGVFHISNRYSKANNKYLKCCDSKQESRHIIYLDANNYMVMRCLNFFQQVDSNGEIQKSLTWINYDLKYPKELWELQNDYPLAPDKIEIKKEMFSDYQLKVLIFVTSLLSILQKLVPISNFPDQEKYVIHYEKLNLYVRLGLKLKKVHHVLKFNQSQWLKQYVEFNSKKEWKHKKMMTKMEKPCAI